MSVYKKASQQKLRIATERGPLSVEQLWDLPLQELDTLAVSLQEKYETSKGKSFLETKSKKDKNIKLQFDLVLDILETKVKNAETASKAAETRAHNEKIDTLIAEKQEEELKGKSVKELEAMRK